MPRRPGDAEAPRRTVAPEHFDNLYAEKPDPWDFAGSWYEQRKYQLIAASLPKQRYRSCYEAGCSIGEMTRLLAQRCDAVTAVDCSPRAVELARQAVHGHVRVNHAVLPRDLPDGETFDLIIATEILYYFTTEDLTSLLDGLLARLEPTGELVAAHWRASDKSYGYDGYNVHDALNQRAELERVVHLDDENFVLDVYRRPPAG